MLLNIPTAIWLGFITFIFLSITAYFGITMFYFKKNVFKYHKYFAFLTIIIAIMHMILAIYLWFFGISI